MTASDSSVTGSGLRGDRSQKRLAVGLLVITVLFVSRGPGSMSGDAPHYLAVSHSLVHDFDLDLANQYGPGANFLFRTNPGEHARRGRGDRLYPFHSIGLSVLIAPAFLVAEQIALRLPESVLAAVSWDPFLACRDLLSVAMIALYIATAMFTLRAARSIVEGIGADGAAKLVPAVTFLAFATPPLLSLSILVFTEVPAAFLCAWFLSESVEATPRKQRRLLALALLPWLHPRYAIIWIAGFFWVVGRADSRETRSWGSALSYVAVPAASATALVASGWWMFGTLIPLGQFGDSYDL